MSFRGAALPRLPHDRGLSLGCAPLAPRHFTHLCFASIPRRSADMFARLAPSTICGVPVVVHVMTVVAIFNRRRNKRDPDGNPRRIPIIGAIPSAVAIGPIGVVRVVNRHIRVFDDCDARIHID